VEAITALAVLPLGSPGVLGEVDKFAHTHGLWHGCAPRSLLLYGPPGTGKTHLAQGVATALGALFINLSAGNVEGKFTDKDGPAGVLQAVFDVAKDPGLGPVVIYLDDIEKMVPGGKPKKGGAGGAAGPDRFKKLLPGYMTGLRWVPPPPPPIYNLQPPAPPLPPPRATSLPSSSDPTLADPKFIKECFDASFFIPPPSHSERLAAWKWEVAHRVVGGGGGGGDGGGGGGNTSGPMPTQLAMHLPSSLNFTALASISEGFTVGAIRAAVAATLTPSRVTPAALAASPLEEEEFLGALSAFPCVTDDAMEKFRDFQDLVCGYSAVRNPPEPAAPPKKK